jgi:hypothetical protein
VTITSPMLSEGCPFKVVRTTGGYEVLARASNLPIGRAVLETAKRMYPRAPNPPLSSQVTADAAAASLRRHVVPKDLPGAIKQLDDQELDRLQAALTERKRRGRKPALSGKTPGKIEAAAIHACHRANALPHDGPGASRNAERHELSR